MLDLMEEKPYGFITIKDIAMKAGIARSTFYMHFSSQEDVLKSRLGEICKDYLVRLRRAIESPSFTPSMPGVLSFDGWAANRRFFLALDGAGAGNLLHAAMYRCIEESLSLLSEKGVISRPPQDAQALMVDYLTGAHATVIRRWLKEGCSMEPEALANFHIEMLSSLRSGTSPVFGPTKGYRFRHD